MKKIGFITSAPEKLNYYFPTKNEPFLVPLEPPFTPDDQIIVDFLRQNCNIQVNAVIWGTPIEELNQYDVLIIRSPWDYADTKKTRIKFLSWIDGLDNAGIKVLNTSRFIKWMLDKHYLKDFEKVGIPIIPTKYTQIDENIDLEQIYSDKGPFIIKPCVSACGFGLRFIKNEKAVKLYQHEINKEAQYTEFMIQDFIKEIQTNGEWSLIYFGNKYSHSICKKPAADSILVHAERGGSLNFSEPENKLIQFGNKIINLLPQAFEVGTSNIYENDSLYIRIDIIESASGCYLSECEGVEPELFFRAKADSEAIFAERLCQYLF